ncbi:MAG: hypothetical protein GX053_01360 [Tissierella sp.]|nr:hypothetical protein [Tissierella sp.]
MKFIDKLLYKKSFSLIITIIIVFIIILIPLLLNTVIINNNLYSKASNDGWASFFGGYIGALVSGSVTLITVTWTIGETRRIQEVNKKDTEKRSVMPYLLFEENYEEVGSFNYKTNKIEKKLMFYGGRNLVNYGRGVARNIKIYIDDNEDKIETPIILLNQKFELSNVHKLDIGEIKDKYDLNIEYQNIYGDKYISKYILEAIKGSDYIKFNIKELYINEVKVIED